MKHSFFLLFIIFVILITSCKVQTKKVINGSIYIKLIDLSSLYKESKEKINTLKKQIDDFDKSKSNEAEKLYYNYYKTLFEEKLINKHLF